MNEPAVGFALYFGVCLLVGLAAHEKGRSGLGFCLLSILFTPLLGGLLVLLFASDGATLEKRRLARETRACPHCAEPIRKAAHVCRYCGRDVLSTVRGEARIHLPGR